MLNVLFSVFCFILMAVGSVQAQDAGTAANINGSFEDTEPGIVEDLEEGVEGWVLSGGESVGTAPEFEIVEDPVQDGNHALRVLVNELSANQWDVEATADAIPVVPGTTYQYSIWARSESGGGTANFTVGNYAFNEYGRIGSGEVALTDEWQEFTFEFTVTDEETEIRAPVHFNFAANVGNAIYIDNLRIVDPDAGKRPVIVEAESGEVGSEFETLEDEENEATYISITTNFNETTGDAGYPGANRTVSYTVSFPDSGLYDLLRPRARGTRWL